MARVLVIDDDPAVLDTYGTLLRLEHHEVMTAPTGQDGLACLRSRNDIDLILLDLRMPDICGLEVLARSRALTPVIPVIMMSMFASADSETAAKKLGAVDFLDKTEIDLDSLGPIVRRITRGSILAAPCGEPPARASTEHLEAHAAARWAQGVVRVLESVRDPRTLADWARCAGASVATLKSWCRRAGLRPHRSLLFARMLRAIVNRQCLGWRVEDSLDVVEDRTLAALLRLCGSTTGAPQDLGDMTAFLDQQRLIRDPIALREIRRRLERLGILSS
jgi:CheY-like chemotaxis protein